MLKLHPPTDYLFYLYKFRNWIIWAFCQRLFNWHLDLDLKAKEAHRWKLASNTDSNDRVVIWWLEIPSPSGDLDLLRTVSDYVAVLPILGDNWRRWLGRRLNMKHEDDIRGCSHITSAKIRSSWTPPSSAMVSIWLTPPPPLVSIRQHLPDGPFVLQFFT